MSVDGGPAAGRHILMELGFSARRSGEELHGVASVTPQMHVPGTGQLRTSILATWADTLGGLLAAHATCRRSGPARWSPPPGFTAASARWSCATPATATACPSSPPQGRGG
jgi:hypothetical protein